MTGHEIENPETKEVEVVFMYDHIIKGVEELLDECFSKPLNDADLYLLLHYKILKFIDNNF